MKYVQANMKVKQYLINKKPDMLVFLGQGLKDFYEEQQELGYLNSVAAVCRFLDIPRDIMAASIKGDFFDTRCRSVANIQRLYEIYHQNHQYLPEMVLYVEHRQGLCVSMSTKRQDLEEVRVALKRLCKDIEITQSVYSKGYRDALAYRSRVDVETVNSVLRPEHTGFRLTTYLDVLRGMGCMVEFKLLNEMKESNVCESI